MTNKPMLSVDPTEALLSRAKHYKKGSIIPHRIARLDNKKYQHRLVFGCDTWIIRIGGMYVVGGDVREGNCLLHQKKRPSRFKRVETILVRNMCWIPWHDWEARYTFADEFYQAYWELHGVKS